MPIPSVFLGHSVGKKGYKLLNIGSFSIFYSRNALFHEHIFPYSSPNYSHLFPPFTSTSDFPTFPPPSTSSIPTSPPIVLSSSPTSSPPSPILGVSDFLPLSPVSTSSVLAPYLTALAPRKSSRISNPPLTLVIMSVPLSLIRRFFLCLLRVVCKNHNSIITLPLILLGRRQY